MRSHDLNRLLDEPGPRARIGPHRKYIFGKEPGLTSYRENGCLKARSCVPLRQPMPNCGVGWPIVPQFEASRPFSVWALISGHSPRGVAVTWSMCPPAAMGTGMAPGNTDRSYVCMIAITALQQG